MVPKGQKEKDTWRFCEALCGFLLSPEMLQSPVAALLPVQSWDPILEAFSYHTLYLSFTSHDFGSCHCQKTAWGFYVPVVLALGGARVSFPSWIFSFFPVGAAVAFQASLNEEKYLHFENELLLPVTAVLITGLTSE